MFRLVRQSVLYFMIAMLGVVIPLTTAPFDVSPNLSVARAEETRCIGRKQAVETSLQRVEEELAVLDTKIRANTDNSIANPTIDDQTRADRRRAYTVLLNRTDLHYATAETNLVRFASNRCGLADFNSLHTRLLAAYHGITGHIQFATSAAVVEQWELDTSREIPNVRRIPNITYDSESNDCRLLIGSAENTIRTAEINMESAGPILEQWRQNQKETEQAAQFLNTARTSITTARNVLRALQEKKCDEGETAGNYRDLKGRVDTLTRNYQKLESDLGNAAVSKLNTTLNAVDGVADDLDACKCSEIDLLVLESATNNPLTNSIQKALCYVICGISVALGRFACMIVGYVIDPIMGDEEAGTSTKRSCNPTFTSSSSSSSGGSAAADGGGGAPGKGTNPAPTATNVEGGDDGESGDDPGPRATVAE